MATLAKQERIRISDRTKAGLQKARRAGKVLGRPNIMMELGMLLAMRAEGKSLRAIAAETGISVPTVMKALRSHAQV